MSNTDDFKKCGINLSYLRALTNELESALTDAEGVANSYNNVPYVNLSDNERVKFVVAVAKAMGFAMALSEEGSLLSKQLKSDMMYGPMDPNSKASMLETLKSLSFNTIGGNDPHGGGNPFGGGDNGGANGVGTLQ